MSVPELRMPEREKGARILAAVGAEPGHPEPCPDVQEAASRVIATWQNDRGDALTTSEATEVLQWLVTAVNVVRDGGAVPANGPAATALGRHLLTLLRTETLRAWGQGGESPEMGHALATMNAIEVVGAAIEPDWAQYFGSRLSGPDGLDLVVEVAHDLRSPLTSVLFLAETLQRGQSGEVNDVQRRQLGLIYAAALGLSSMASDVIELARGGDQLVEKDPSAFSVTAILEAVRDMVRLIAEEKGLTLRLLPPASDHRMGRSLALSRVLLNLTTNALKFTDEGYVEIAAQAKGLSVIEFAVRDTGHGISPDALANLYQPFRRTRGRARRSGYYFSGTGLGLAMCRKLVQAMGSELKLETRPDWGTRFFFELNLPPSRRL